jgi:GNAT superfamily N-acetyltransferase
MPGWMILPGIFDTEREGPVMIRYKMAGKQHFDELLEIIYHQKDPNLKPVLDLIQLTADHFARLFRSTGVVYRIEVDGRLAGLCWVEKCGRILYLHKLMIQEPYQRQGIGTKTLEWLEGRFRGEIDQIELRVHASNPRAKALYERCGYTVTNIPGPSGMYMMCKKISGLLPLADGVRSRDQKAKIEI